MTSNDIVRTERRESRAGYHFINLYQQCPRKWFLHYGLGLLPTKTGKALIYGKAWHEACGDYYVKRSLDAALALGLGEIEACRAEYKVLDDYVVDQAKMRKLLPLWVQWVDGVLAEYNVVEVETPYEIKLVSGATMTIRPDVVLEHKTTKTIVIGEHKTTSYSIDNMINTVDCQDQATAYSWGLCKARPDLAPRFGGVLLDVAYVRVTSGKLSETAKIDSALIHRTKRDFAEFELSMAGLFNEVGQKYLAWRTDPGRNPVPVLFPRNGNTCSLFGCEYSSICRMAIDKTTKLGDDFEWDPSVCADDRLIGKGPEASDEAARS